MLLDLHAYSLRHTSLVTYGVRVNAYDLHDKIFPQLVSPIRREVLSPKIKISNPRMAPGVRNSKRVRASKKASCTGTYNPF
jgi:hypothetical protein